MQEIGKNTHQTNFYDPRSSILPESALDAKILSLLHGLFHFFQKIYWIYIWTMYESICPCF